MSLLDKTQNTSALDIMYLRVELELKSLPTFTHLHNEWSLYNVCLEKEKEFIFI